MRRFSFCAFMLLFFLRLASATSAMKGVPEKDQKTNSRTVQSTGEEIFKANCARCHTPPMSISPRITGTVIMHMRTRARLSREDEQLLLKYMAP